MVMAIAPNPDGRGHAGVVYPSTEPYNADTGPMIGQAGVDVDIFSAQQAFHSHGLTPRYFALPRR